MGKRKEGVGTRKEGVGTRKEGVGGKRQPEIKYHVILLYYHVTWREDALGDIRIEWEKRWKREGEEVKDADLLPAQVR